jgi:cytochrome c-type protein NapC
MRIWKWIGGLTGAVGIAGVAVGVLIGLPVIDKVDQVFSSNQFCADSCHVMTETVAKELATSAHGTTHLGVVPECRDCHLSDTLVGAMVDHVKGLNDLYAYVVKGIRTPEDFETVRFEAANKVRMRFFESDSANCRGCHVMDKIVPEKKRGVRQHAEAREKDITCIVCHYNLVHKETDLSEEFDAIVGSF